MSSIQRLATGDELGGTQAEAGVAEVLHRRRGSGRPLDRADADRFGSGFGADLSSVRLHTDSEADSVARSVQSVAFTYGRDVYFTRGSYQPGTDSGDHLLAHELAHVVQGSSGRWAATGSRSGSGVQIGKADDPAETAADQAADQVMAQQRRGDAPDPAVVGSLPVVTGEPIARTVRRAGLKSLVKKAFKGKKKKSGPKGRPSESKTLGGATMSQLRALADAQQAGSGSRRARGKRRGKPKTTPASDEKSFDNARSELRSDEDSDYDFSPEEDSVDDAKVLPQDSDEESSSSVSATLKDDESSLASETILDDDDVKTDDEESSSSESVTESGSGAGSEEKAPVLLPPVVVPVESKDDDEESSSSDSDSDNDDDSMSSSEEDDEVKEAPTPLVSRPTETEKAESDDESSSESKSDNDDESGSSSSSGSKSKNDDDSSSESSSDEEPEGPGDGRKQGRHTAFLNGSVDAAYADETKKASSEPREVIELLLANLRRAHELIADLTAGMPLPKAMTKGGMTREVHGVVMSGGSDLDKIMKNLRYYIEDRTELCRRQDIPLTDDLELGDIDDRIVTYDSKEDQARSTVTVKDGRLCRADGEPVDTSQSSTFVAGLGNEIFVASEKGELHMASHKIGKYHHSSLLAGSEVSIGGEMKVKDGRIEWINNKSGHYKPSKDHLVQFLHWLWKDGVDLNFIDVKEGFGVPGGMTAKQIVDGVTAEGKDSGYESFHALKLRSMMQAYEAELGVDVVDRFLDEQGWTWDEKVMIEKEDDEDVDDKYAIEVLKKKFGMPGAIKSLVR